MEVHAAFILCQCPSGVAATTRASDRGEEGKIGLPGGKVDPGETPRDAAIREAKEEGFSVSGVEADPFFITEVEGGNVAWFRAENAEILKSFKEKGRIQPFFSTMDQIANSGYGNDEAVSSFKGRKTIKFSSENDAIQYLADLTGQRIKVAEFVEVKEIIPHLEDPPVGVAIHTDGDHKFIYFNEPKGFQDDEKGRIGTPEKPFEYIKDGRLIYNVFVKMGEIEGTSHLSGDGDPVDVWVCKDAATALSQMKEIQGQNKTRLQKIKWFK